VRGRSGGIGQWRGLRSVGGDTRQINGWSMDAKNCRYGRRVKVGEVGGGGIGVRSEGWLKEEM